MWYYLSLAMQYSWTNFKNYEKTVFSYYFEDEKTISKFECFYSNVEYSTAVVFPRNFFQLQIIKFIIRVYFCSITFYHLVIQ